MPSPATYVFSPVSHAHLVPYLAALHGSCITNDHLIHAFLPPLNHEKLLAWWKAAIADATAAAASGTAAPPKLIIVILLDESEPGTRAKGAELVGAALLRLPDAETSPFRAADEALLVSTRWRRRGGAAMLIQALHTQALIRGRTVMTAEAESDSIGEMVMKKFGYVEVGRVPNYAISPRDHKRKDQTILYQELAFA